jgi:stearoyl-CoA desaturase (delta-9 desaturase)
VPNVAPYPQEASARVQAPVEVQAQAVLPADEHDHGHDHDHEHAPMPLGQRIINLIAILLPLAGLIVAMALTWGWGLTWVELTLMGVMYLLTGLGVTVGYHRLFTHKSFQTSRIMTAVLGVLGSMSVEGPITRWVAFHRKHHQHSDAEGDPHSPHTHGGGILNILRGFWHAHAGWLFQRVPGDLDRYVPDLQKDKLVRTLSRLFPVWVLLGLLIPAAIGGLVTLSWTGVLLGFLWGGLVRILLIHHVTWSVNSICHIWGSRPFRSHDESRNNPIVGVLALGEGWHNNHHAFPTSARHGLRWWQVDVSWIVIWAMARLGLAWNVRVPTPDRIIAKRA